MTENNVSIMDLCDIVSPEPVGFWPLAPFGWILLGLVAMGMVVLIWRATLHWKAGAYRREGLERLSRIEAAFSTVGKERTALQELAILLKRVALAAFPRRHVAPLYGKAWLRFLDKTCNGCTFSKGPGQLLLSSAASETTDATTIANEGRKLLHLSRVWIKGHRLQKVNTDELERGRVT